MPNECSATPALDWTPGPAGMFCAWLGLWELTVFPAKGTSGWQFHVVNPMGDTLNGRRLDRAVAMADCHELAERLAGGVS